jgi:hypothetical protein
MAFKAVKEVCELWQQLKSSNPTVAYSMNTFNQALTREIEYGPNHVKITGKSQYKNQHMFTIVPIVPNDKEKSKERIVAFAEALSITLQKTKKGKDGSEASIFWKAYDKNVTPNMIDKFKKMTIDRSQILSIGYSVIKMKALDKFFLDDDICRLLCFMFKVKNFDALKDDKEKMLIGWAAKNKDFN